MVEIQLDAYLDRLKGAEGYQRVNERRQVPTYVELANECGISPVTLSRIANGHIKQLNLSVLACLITSLRRRGFATDVSDLLVYQEASMSDSTKDKSQVAEMMTSFREFTQQELKLRQPSIRKQEYELRSDNALVGTLHWPRAFGSLCVAATADGSWTFNRMGFFNFRVNARAVGSEQDLLIYRPKWTGMTGAIEHIDGREFGLQAPSMWGNRFALVQKPTQGKEVELLAVSFNFSLLRGSADVELQPQLAQTEDAALLAMFGCYLATMVFEETSGMS